MHPEIEKYWKEKGKSIHTQLTAIGDTTIYYYEIPGQNLYVSITDNNVIAIHSKTIFFGEQFNYIIDDHLYDEKTALRLIKLMSFL